MRAQGTCKPNSPHPATFPVPSALMHSADKALPQAGNRQAPPAGRPWASIWRGAAAVFFVGTLAGLAEGILKFAFWWAGVPKPMSPEILWVAPLAYGLLAFALVLPVLASWAVVQSLWRRSRQAAYHGAGSAPRDVAAEVLVI